MLTKNEIRILAEAIRPLDCGVHYCRYCQAGTHNQWLHAEYCGYEASVYTVEMARAILDREARLCSQK